MASKRRSLPKKSLSERIREYANKKGVTILIDTKGESQEAKYNTPFSFAEKTKRLLIVAPLLAKKDEDLLNEIIRKAFNDGQLILKAKTEETLESYRKYSSENKYNKVLEFFAGILSPDDYSALKMSLYLRDQMSKNARNVHKLKQDIRDKFGERGANIANLCTAGYFEKDFMPIYNQVSKNEFYDYYNLAVGIKAKALFVHSAMTIQEMEAEFNSMIDKAVKYHIKEFAIHGLGGQNVANINEFVNTKTNSEEKRFIIKKVKETKNPVAIQYIVTMIPQKNLG